MLLYKIMFPGPVGALLCPLGDNRFPLEHLGGVNKLKTVLYVVTKQLLLKFVLIIYF